MTFNFQRLFRILFIFGFLAFLSANVYAEQGLFWKVESPAGNVSYLFGTMHTDDNRVTDFSPAVNEAIKSIDAFMMETLTPDDPGVFMRPEGSLQDILSEKELNTVYELAEFHTMHREAAMHMKPWLLAVVFDSPKPLTPFAQDNLLMTKAEDLGKEVIGIEDTREHFGVMDSFSLDEQSIMLRAVLRRSPEQKEHDFERLIHAYLAGDSEKIANLDEKITGGMLPPALWGKMRAKLLDERNVVMAQRIAKEARNKKVFAAVGASHLAGKGGLIARLKEAGFNLSPLN
jgi:uncharacterized protein YbaP (TraB family)